MYQAYVVQKFNDKQCLVTLGDTWQTEQDAFETVMTYIKYFGKVDHYGIEPSDVELPTCKPPKRTLLQRLIDWI